MHKFKNPNKILYSKLVRQIEQLNINYTPK